MTNHDESLEVGLAAGLDVPTALVISERDDHPPRKGCATAAGVLAIVAVLVCALFRAV